MTTGRQIERNDMEGYIDNFTDEDDDNNNEKSQGSSSDGQSLGRPGDSSASGTGTDRVSETGTIAKKESKQVIRLKISVAIVLVCSTLAVAFSVFSYIRNSEQTQFEVQFRDDATKVLEAIETSLDSTLASLDGVAVALVSHARATNQQWPFVTMPNFAVRMSKMLPLTDAIYINVVPIVKKEERLKWEEYSLANDDWVNEGMAVQESWPGYRGPVVYNGTRHGTIHGDFGDIQANLSRFMPTWQNYPVVPNTSYTYNFDWLSISFPEAYLECITKHRAILSQPYMIPNPGDTTAEEETAYWVEYFRDFISPDEEPLEPVSDILYPIIGDVDEEVSVVGASDYKPSDHEVVGMLAGTIYWRSAMRNILPQDSNGILVVVTNPCTNSFTYEIDGSAAIYKGVGDLHSQSYNHFMMARTLSSSKISVNSSIINSGARLDEDFCSITLKVYPSEKMQARFVSADRWYFTVAVIAIFGFTASVFAAYDTKVERRQQTTLGTATRASAIVSSLFPSEVRERLYPSEQQGKSERGKLYNFLKDSKSGSPSMQNESAEFSSSPIAELYPETTVLFADIAGFTAWSSIRQPTQVFQLLETLYAAFDEIAKQRRIFKVETIGDSYVAVVGLPAPRKNHAVAMARFADDCIRRMAEVTKELGNVLGPETAELALRIGMNSGPTTAGVLRGEKSRFQLFGDTVNTASRMESSGERNRIQVSQKTADLLLVAGKGHWLNKRDKEVNIKGKGLMTTFWCCPKEGSGPSDTPLSDARLEADETANEAADAHRDRLVDWNVDVLTGLLHEITSNRSESTSAISGANVDTLGNGIGKDFFGMPLAEVKEAIKLRNPSNRCESAAMKLQLCQSVKEQLKRLVLSIAKMYRPNAFHNFEHCSHVAMSTKKLLDRIAENNRQTKELSADSSSTGDSMTLLKIASDPLTRFALVFAALIHDVDHLGVSNQQLNEEHNPVAIAFLGKSVAEQNSVNIAWRLLMQHQFADLRACIYSTEAELGQLRALVVNAVMSTDLFDKDLKAMRELRWSKTFSDEAKAKRKKVAVLLGGEDSNRKATVIIELVIQASDVSHTMQHFTVYKKWNMNLLAEMYDAYHCGRTPKDPLQGWYEGELWFFDNYVIPLAEKLRECGVFGVLCDEFLNYATDNRHEWEAKGRDILRDAAEMVKSRPIRSHTDVMSEVYT